MASTTIDLDTELSAVNSILGAIGQAPVTSLVFDNPEISFIYNLLRDANVDTQAEGWHFNTELHVTFTPDSITGKIAIANDVLQLDVSKGWARREYNVVRRGGFLYDKIDHTDDFSTITSIDLDVVKLYNYEDLPTVFKRYITYRASRQAATQLVANPNLVKLITQQESLARAAIMEYECNQGNHSMFGFPENTAYQTYQPWTNLRR
tara:strand:- start:2810 stop:3430 length:621 start_codon:yes stop_codon:yes gene_type:complete